jgi:hypothetical protein
VFDNAAVLRWRQEACVVPNGAKLRRGICEKRVTKAEIFPAIKILFADFSASCAPTMQLEKKRSLHQPWALTTRISILGLPSSTAEKGWHLKRS